MQLTGSWARWVLAGAGALLLAGSGLWIENFRLSLSSTNQLIAQAYTEQRTVELRFPGASYGPLRQQRGEHISQRESPQALKDAKVQIARRLAHGSKEPNWLQAKARIDLLEGHFQAAIDTLQQAVVWHPDDSSLKVDLATAYFERAEPTGQPADYAPALDLLNQVLSNNPNHSVAIFNRAIVYERQHKYAEAMADWQRYLQVDPSGGWAAEANTRKEEAKTRRSE
jgi:tetratricopeptide (TPR) repeat protein